MRAAFKFRAQDAGLRTGDRAWLLFLLAIFVLYGIANSLNHLLVHQFMKVFGISRLRASWLQTIYYLGYVIAAVPAGIYVERFGARRVLQFGLSLFTISSVLIAAATSSMTYGAVLLPMFLLALSVSVLESTAGPCVLASASGQRGARRLCVAQAFNSMGMVLGATFGTFVVFGNEGGSRPVTHAAAEATRACMPFLLFAGIAVMLWMATRNLLVPLLAEPGQRLSIDRVLMPLRSPRFVLIFVTALIYMGTQTCTWSFLLQYLREYGIASDHAAGLYYMATLALFAMGRVVQSFALRRPNSSRLLMAAAALGTMCLVFAVAHPGANGGLALVACGLPLSVIYPVLYVKGVQPLGEHGQAGGSLMVCSLLGGALAPPLMARVAREAGSYATSYTLPLCGFLWILAVSMWLFLHREQPAAQAAVRKGLPRVQMHDPPFREAE